jgi:CBS domain containing-hemolysin-like protein
MTPRVDVIAIDIDTPKDEIKKIFYDQQFSRVPVYRETPDHIEGVLFEKDFFKAYLESKNFSLKKLITKPLFVVGSMHADSLLQLLKKRNVHMAIVLDEYGGFDGVVTMEDTLEELVGEIFDEHDEVPFRIEKQEENRYLVNGDLEIENLFEELDLEKVPEDIDATTVGGWVQDSLERLPEVGDTVTFRVVSKILYNELDSDEGIEYVNLHFTVNEIKDHRITILDLTVEKETGEETKEEEKESKEE